jgi:hypothetical protein
VADERPHHAQPLGLDDDLHGVGDVAEAVAHPALLDGLEERALRDVEELGGERRDLADREGPRGVRDPAVLDTPMSMEMTSPRSSA